MQACRVTSKHSEAASLRTVMQGSSYLPVFMCNHKLRKHRRCGGGHKTQQCNNGQSSTHTWPPTAVIQDSAQHMTKKPHRAAQHVFHLGCSTFRHESKCAQAKIIHLLECNDQPQLVTMTRKKLWAGSPLGDAAQTNTMQLQRAGTM